MTIKNIILSGGGHTLFQSLGIIQTLEKNNIWKIENIEKIYGTSAGSLLGAILCLKFDWDTVNDYLLNRPWHDVFSIDIKLIMDIYSKKGLFNRNFFEIAFKPLLHAKDLSLDITLKELYDYSQIELHLFTFDINNFKFEDVNYKSHPDLSLITAIYMSSAIPILFSPVCFNNKCYIDGGFVSNYPLTFCVEQNCNMDEILGIKNGFNNECNDSVETTTASSTTNTTNTTNTIDNDSTILDFIISFFHKVILNLNIDNKQYNIKYEVNCNCQYMSYSFFNKAISSFDIRKQLFEDGIDCGNKFVNNITPIETGTSKDAIDDMKIDETQGEKKDEIE
jgi:predicted acylesterase/phospholipase RssA